MFFVLPFDFDGQGDDFVREDYALVGIDFMKLVLRVSLFATKFPAAEEVLLLGCGLSLVIILAIL